MKRLLLAPFLITLITGCSLYDKSFQERRDDCADALARAITLEKFTEKYKIALKDKRQLSSKTKKREGVALFCQFYINHRLL